MINAFSRGKERTRKWQTQPWKNSRLRYELNQHERRFKGKSLGLQHTRNGTSKINRAI